jgi:hypothetical protein
MVDAADLKSASCKGVWVRVPPSAVAKVVSNFLQSRLQGLSPESIEFYQGYLKVADTVIGFHTTGQDISQFLSNLNCTNDGKHAYYRAL